MIQKNPKSTSKSIGGQLNFVSPSPVRAVGELHTTKAAFSSSNIFVGGGQMDQGKIASSSRRSTATKEQINAVINKNQSASTLPLMVHDRQLSQMIRGR